MCCCCRTAALFNAELFDTMFFQACVTSVNLCTGYHAWQRQHKLGMRRRGVTASTDAPKLTSKCLDLILHSSKLCRLGVDIHHRLVLDVAGTVCIFQGVQRFLQVSLCTTR